MKKKNVVIITSIIVVILITVLLCVLLKKDKPKSNIEDTKTEVLNVVKFDKSFKDYGFKLVDNKYIVTDIKKEELFSAFYYEFFEKDYIFQYRSFPNNEIISHFLSKENSSETKELSIIEEKNRFIVEIR